MQKIYKKLLVPFFIFLFLAPQFLYSANKTKTVAIFFSWNDNLAAYQGMLDGFYSIFDKSQGIYNNIIIEYMDIQRLQSESYAHDIVAMYNRKYANTPIDLIIVFGPSGYKVLKQFGLKALAKSPVISVENEIFNDFEPITGNADVAQIILRYDFRKTIQTAFDLFPDRKNVYVINGHSYLDISFQEVFRQAAGNFMEDRNFIYMSNISMDSILHAVKGLPDNSMIFIPSFFMDGDSVFYSTPEVQSLVAAVSKVPVLPVVDTYTHQKGALGGYVFSYKSVGKEIGRAANLILAGKSLGEIHIKTSGFNQQIFDWDELTRWKLNKSKVLSKDAVYYYKKQMFILKYKWYILGLLSFLVLQTFVIAYLMKTIRNQKETARLKLETESIYRDLVRQDRLLKMSELTASLSHELNQPLTAILFNAQAGKRFIQSGKIDLTQAEEIFDYIIEDDKRAGGIISSLKNLMKHESRDKEDVELNLLIRQTVEIINSDAITHRIIIRTNLVNSPVMVYAERVLIQQVLLNFFRNAMNAMEDTPAGNKYIDVKIHIGKGNATVSVRDTGKGIQPEIRDKLFKPFVTGNKNGFGIGLALSKTIIEKHNGEIWALNLPQGGAEFSFRLKINR